MADKDNDNDQPAAASGTRDGPANIGGGAPAADQQAAPQAGVLGQYIKDLSFENPNAPASLQAQSNTKPAIDVNVNVNVAKLNDEVYEVELKLSATASQVKEDQTKQAAFVCELAYGTLFGVRNLPEDALRPFLLVQAPTLMFPFARRIIADATRDGGFPPLMLEPINFEALYRTQMAQAAQQSAGNAADAPASNGAADAPQPINLN